VADARVSKDISFTERYVLTLMLQVFNVANKQNIDGFASTSGYSLAGIGVGTGSATWNTSFLVPNSSNNSGFLYTRRELEIAAKFHF
jgi:hypothetical protein